MSAEMTTKKPTASQFLFTLQSTIADKHYNSKVDNLSTPEGCQAFYDKLWREGALDIDTLLHLDVVKIKIVPK